MNQIKELKEIKNLIEEVLNDAFVISLGTVDDGGAWVSDLVYINDGFTIYWISMPESRHSKAIEKNGKVAATITASYKTDAERALQIEGQAQVIEGPLFEYEKILKTKRGLVAPNKPGEILSDGHKWYVLKPTKIELIYSKHFGYDKQSLKDF